MLTTNIHLWNTYCVLYCTECVFNNFGMHTGFSHLYSCKHMHTAIKWNNMITSAVIYGLHFSTSVNGNLFPPCPNKYPRHSVTTLDAYNTYPNFQQVAQIGEWGSPHIGIQQVHLHRMVCGVSSEKHWKLSNFWVLKPLSWQGQWNFQYFHHC